jgi:hypothetical protein
MIPPLARSQTDAPGVARVHLALTVPEARQLYDLISLAYDSRGDEPDASGRNAVESGSVDFTPGAPLSRATVKIYEGLRRLAPCGL